jgi:hypothetical protein
VAVKEAAASNCGAWQKTLQDGGSSILTHDRKRLNTGVLVAAL